MAGNAIAFLLTGLTMILMAKASTGGNTPGIALFDENGERIGFKSGTRSGKISDGEYKDITVSPIKSGNNRAPSYISVSGGGEDSLCIAYIYMTPPSQENWGFHGDVPKQCGAKWYHSNLPVQRRDGDPFKPSCFWIDSPHEDTKKTVNGFPQGVSIHMMDFATTQNRVTQYQNNKETMCNSKPRFALYDALTEMNCIPIFNPPLNYNDDGTDKSYEALKTSGQVMCSPGPDTKPSVKDIWHLEQWTGGRFSQPTYGVRKRDLKARQNDRECFADTGLYPDL